MPPLHLRCGRLEFRAVLEQQIKLLAGQLYPAHFPWFVVISDDNHIALFEDLGAFFATRRA